MREMIDEKLQDERGRLAALERYCVLDTAPEEAFERITSLVATVLQAPICAVSLVDRDRQWFKSICGIERSETPRTVAFCSETIQLREPLIVPDAAADPRFAANPLVKGPPHIRSYAGVPLRTPDGYNLGSLCVIDSKPRTFSPAQVEILEKFARIVVDELELRTIAQLDHLTGASTRRAFLADAAKELERFKRYRRPAAMILFDIDNFKSINDRFGHATGDSVLKALSRACGDSLRSNDCFGRLGGEEFAVVLPEATEEDAMGCAERLRRAFAELKVPAGQPITATASYGIASPECITETLETWMARADAALYAAKHAGRDRCIAASSLVRRAAAA